MVKNTKRNHADKVEDETWRIAHVFEAKAGNVNGLKAFLLGSLKTVLGGN